MAAAGSFRSSAVRLSMESYAFLDEEEDLEAPPSKPQPITRSDGKPLAEVGNLAKATTDTSIEVEKKQNKPMTSREQQKEEYRKFKRKCLRRLGLFTYISAVALACASFQLFGCFCVQGQGDCGGFTLARDLGVGWCCALGGGVSVHLYVSVPIALWIRRMYSGRLALRVLFEGAAVGAILTLVLALGLKGMDPPPGFGLSGVPVGSAIFAGLCAWLVLSLAARVGYHRNATLGRTCMRAVIYLVGSVCLGTVASFSLHIGFGIALCLLLLFVLGWVAQVWVTTQSRRGSLLAFLAPLFLGAVFGVTAEMMPGRLGMPPVSGYAIGCGVSFTATVLLSHAFETRGIAGARQLAAFFFAQDLIALAAWTAGYELYWLSGVTLAVVLELLLVATISVAMREGNQFGVWQAGYPLFLMVTFALLLSGVYGNSWNVSVTTGSSAGLAVGLLVYLAFRRFGVLGGMRAIFVSLLCLIQSNLMMIEFLVMDIAAAFALGYGSIVFFLLLVALLVGFRADDGSGRLYGSGVEALAFVMLAQALCYGSGLIMYGVLGASEANAHIAAAILGAIVLLCPSLTQALAGDTQQARKNFRVGTRLSAFYGLLWLTCVLVMRYTQGVWMDAAIQICSCYVVVFVAFLALAILRYLLAVFLIYVAYLTSAVATLALIFVFSFPTPPMITINAMTFIGLAVPMPWLWPLAKQRADRRENAALEREAEFNRTLAAREAAAKAARPTAERKKHSAKAKWLNQHPHNLPKLHELSHSGVMERAGVVRWCNCASDGRPILPFASQLIVARGSFLYLFPSEGELMPTTRALSAIPVYHAAVTPVAEYLVREDGMMIPDDRLPRDGLKWLIRVDLTIPWVHATVRHARLYLQLRSEPQMRAWAADLARRAFEDSSRSKFRRDIYEQAARPDPSLACGMLAVRKAMARATTDAEVRAASRGITCYDDESHATLPPRGAARGSSSGNSSSADVSAGLSRPRSPREIGRSVARRSGLAIERRVRTRIGKAVQRAQAAEQTQELMATNVFSSVVLYTPRGISGGSDDAHHKPYEVERVRYPSLAASAREAMELNEAMDEEARRERRDWLAGKKQRMVQHE